MRRNDLDVFISSRQEEFNRKRKRLEKIVNSMPYLRCELLENRGADTDNTTVRSVKAAKECDFYVGIFGKQYSLITQEECKTALDDNKRCLIYVLNVNEEKTDPRVRDFTDEIRDDYLGGYNKEVVAPFVIFYFENELGYLRQLTNKKVIITSEGRNHCREEFVLPAGL